MQDCGDRGDAEQLALQLKGLLRDKTMTHNQLASCYSISQGHSLMQKLKEMSRDDQMTLTAFVHEFPEHFETVGSNQLKARPAQQPESKAPCQPEPGAEQEREQGERLGAAALAEPMRYSELSRSLRALLSSGPGRPLPLDELDALFIERYKTSVSAVAGMSLAEYLQRKDSLFEYEPVQQTVKLLDRGATVAAGEMDESFVVREFVQLIEALGPVTYISTLCGKFIQRNGISVTSVISSRPLDLFKRHPNSFLVLGAGNVTLKKYESLPEVQRLMETAVPKARRGVKPAEAEESTFEVPDILTEQHVVEEFRRLILADGVDSVYISSLCGRFLQRFKKPVTAIIDGKPAEFLRRYPEIFVMTGGGNVGLREVLGADAVSVLPPPTRTKPVQDDATALPSDFNDKDFRDIDCIFDEEIQKDVKAMLEVLRHQLEKVSFLAVDCAVVGGPVGQGLHCRHGAEIVLFVRQLPFKNFSQWLPHLVETLTPVLQFQLGQLAAPTIDCVKAGRDRVHFDLLAEGLSIPIEVLLSPIFKSRAHLMECIRDSPPDERLYFYAAFVRERNELMAGQSTDVKAIMNLMLWWVSVQPWSIASVRPTKWLVQLLTLRSCRKVQSDRSRLVAAVLRSFADLASLKELWEDADTSLCLYVSQDVWKPLLGQRPLVMDPVNPFCNLLDGFDGSELIKYAQPPVCWSAFSGHAAGRLGGAS
ncbi:unnamed protein product [Symbiodinium microadriaticum]|nr:unnamed protein product [Symbiodinium microadriaticum]